LYDKNKKNINKEKIFLHIFYKLIDEPIKKFYRIINNKKHMNFKDIDTNNYTSKEFHQKIHNILLDIQFNKNNNKKQT